MYEKTLIIIAIDESGSMSGSRWNNSVNGSKELVNYLR
jgi:Mg-chelatase subunit ChlD